MTGKIEMLIQYVPQVVGKLLAEGINSSNITVELAKKKTNNCVGYHIMHEVIDMFFEDIVLRINNYEKSSIAVND